MMKEYIEKEAALDLLGEPITMSMCLSVDECTSKRGQREIDYALIKAIPAADVRPVVRGKWIRRNSWSEGCGMGESYGFYYECSVCKDVVQGGYRDCGMKYCPNCGADMREES